MSNVSTCLWQALHSDLGVEVSTNDPDLFKQRAYKVRASEPDLKLLALRTCPTDPEGKVWITHQGESPAESDSDSQLSTLPSLEDLADGP